MPAPDDETPGDDDAPQEEEEVDLDATRSDLSDDQSGIEDTDTLRERGVKLRAEYTLGDVVDVEVPPAVAEYLRVILEQTAFMTVEERNQLLHKELLKLRADTKRYHFPNGDVLKSAPDEVVLKRRLGGEIEDTEEAEEAEE